MSWFSKGNQWLKRVAVGLLAVNLVAAVTGAVEFAYGKTPSSAAVVVSVCMAALWIGAAAWAGLRGVAGFLWFAAGVWGLVIVILVVGMLVAGTDDLFPGFQVLLLLILFAGAPLQGLTPLSPIENRSIACVVSAAAILLVSAVAHLLARRYGQRAGRVARVQSDPLARP